MKNKERPKLFIVIPCYNEEEMIDYTIDDLNDKILKLIKLGLVADDSRILFVDDGSKDSTWLKIENICKKNKLFCGVKLSKNKGHQNALIAGLMTAKEYADIVISMDADLQDDIDIVDEMIEDYKNGAEIVYGVRSSRKKDTLFKRGTAELFYKFMNLMGVEIVFNHADYRLMSKRSLEALEEYKEFNIFLRGIIPQLGFKTSKIFYERKKREHGQSKYPLNKMIKFAFDGITSFSIKPLKIITNIGFVMFFFSFIVLIYSLIVKIIGNTVPGWTFIAISIWLVAGIQLLSLGVIGEYIGRIFEETKRRPRYIIEKKIF